MLHHVARLTIIAVATLALLSAVLAQDALPRNMPPNQISYGPTAEGPTLSWFQNSDANVITLINQCAGTRGSPRHQLVGWEGGRPGWHHKRIYLEQTISSCILITEFRDTDMYGKYGPFPFRPAKMVLPAVGR